MSSDLDPDVQAMGVVMRERTRDRAIVKTAVKRKRVKLAEVPPPSFESPAGISIEDKVEIIRRAAEARSGTPGIAWNDIKRHLMNRGRQPNRVNDDR